MNVAPRSWPGRIFTALLSAPLRFKITIPYLIVAILLAFLATYLVSQQFAQTLQEQFSSRLADASAQVSDGLFAIEAEQLSALRAIAHTEGVALATQTGDAEALMALVRPLAVNSRLQLVDVVGLHGEPLLAFHLDVAAGGQTYRSDEDADYTTWPLVQRVLAGESDELGDKFIAPVETPWGWAFYTAGPLKDGETLVGVVLVGSYLTNVTRDLFEQSRTGVTIYAPDAVGLASSLGDIGDIRPLSEAALETIRGYGGERLVTRTLVVGTRSYVEALGPLFVRGVPTDYIQGVALPDSLVTEPTAGPSPVQLALWFTIAVLAVIGLGVVIAQVIARPVFELLSASSRVAEGNLDVQVGVHATDEIGTLTESFNRMVRELKQREFMRELFGRMVSEEVREAVLQGQVALGGELKTVTIFFTDVRGFTSLSETISPPEVVQVINSYFRIVNAGIREYGGTINRFGGDSSLAIFGAPVDLPAVESARRAISAALRIRTELLEANARRLEAGQRLLEVGIGINTGEVVTGNIGSEERFEYTVIGDTVNTAARVQGLSAELGVDILITDSTHRALGPEPGFILEDRGEVNLRGKSQAVRVFGVHGLVRREPLDEDWQVGLEENSRDILEGLYLSCLGLELELIAQLKRCSPETVKAWQAAARRNPEAAIAEIERELGVPSADLFWLRAQAPEKPEPAALPLPDSLDD